MASDPRPPMITLRSRVGRAVAGATLLDFLCRRFRYHTESEWESRIADGAVRVDGRVVTADLVLRAGSEVSYDKIHAEPPAPTEVPVVYDERGVVVIDKPSGLPMHADGAFLTRTVVATLERQLGVRPRVVQRLDRETSGLCVLARDRRTAHGLHESLQAGRFEKTYEAVVRGIIFEDRLSIALWIGRDPDSQVSIRRAALPPGSPEARSAHTEIEVLQRRGTVTLVRCVPRTGRTHQIRAHLQAIGHPLVGDKLYGQSDEDYLAWVAFVKSGGDPAGGARLGADRQLLHAAELAFDDPRSGTRLRFESPRPADFEAVLTNER